MSREIKFRAWDNVDSKMLYTGEEDEVSFYFDSYGIKACRAASEENDYQGEELDHLIYMWQMALKDKNGVGFYEGDIVQGSTDIFSKMTGKIVFVGGKYVVDGVGKYKNIREELNSLYEVIGNIYESPELIHGS